MKYLLLLLGCCLLAGCGKSGGDLHKAAHDGDLSLVKKLVAKGSDVNARDDLGSTPLHYAANQYHMEVMKFLLEKGADVNAQQNGGTTPLGHAVFANGPEFAQLLLEKGADPSIQHSNGLTPLDDAEMLGRTATAELLRKHGAKRGGLKIGVIEPGTKAQAAPPANAKYKMVVLSAKGEEISELMHYGTEIVQTPHGGTTLVTSPSSRISPSLQRFPSGARVDIIELKTKKVVFTHTY
jgi:hypothetical protein